MFASWLVGLIVLYFVWLYVRKPVLIKLGLRNIPRRPTQTALIIVGLTLSTIIFLSSFAIGDTLNYSVQQQAINAYGAIDEVLAPPIFSLLVGLDDQAIGEDEAVGALEDEFTQLTEGGLSTVLAIVQGGLPSISEERFRTLKAQAEDEPLIDGVAGSILFPTIIRDVSSGQGEPFGFIFAVDNDYDEQFGLVTVDGEPVEMEVLEPGVGNIFGQTANLFGLVGDFGSRLGLDESAISGAAALTAAVGAAVTLGSEGGFDPAAIEIDVETIRSLGVDTTPLDDAGIETLSLEALGITPENLEAMGVPTGTLSIDSLPVDNLNVLGVDVADMAAVTTDLLGALNLNTLGRELDGALSQSGAATAPGRRLPQPPGRGAAQRPRRRRARNLHRPDPAALPRQSHRRTGRADRGPGAGRDDAPGRGAAVALHARQGQQHPGLQSGRRALGHRAHRRSQQPTARAGHG